MHKKGKNNHIKISAVVSELLQKNLYECHILIKSSFILYCIIIIATHESKVHYNIYSYISSTLMIITIIIAVINTVSYVIIILLNM